MELAWKKTEAPSKLALSAPRLPEGTAISLDLIAGVCTDPVVVVGTFSDTEPMGSGHLGHRQAGGFSGDATLAVRPERSFLCRASKASEALTDKGTD